MDDGIERRGRNFGGRTAIHSRIERFRLMNMDTARRQDGKHMVW